jgi:hypothetical protein
MEGQYQAREMELEKNILKIKMEGQGQYQARKMRLKKCKDGKYIV